MFDRRSTPFDEALLSAYLDGELTQEESQAVRLHLEECADSRRTYERMREIREATMTTPFPVIDDGQWDERPRSRSSRVLRGAGWALLLVWLGALAVTMAREIAAEVGGMSLDEILMIGGLAGGALLLLLSVLLDRLHTYGKDRYRRVKR